MLLPPPPRLLVVRRFVYGRGRGPEPRLRVIRVRLLYFRRVDFFIVIITSIIVYYLLYDTVLKTDSSTDHSADTGAAARPATADLALDEDTSIFIAESHATSAAVALVIGVE